MTGPSGALRSAAAAFGLALLLASCTTSSTGPEEPDGHPLDVAIDAFVEAWNDRDYETMNSFFTGDTHFGAFQLKEQIEAVFLRGAIEKFEVEERDLGSFEEGISEAAVPYVIKFRSAAAKKKITLSGEMEWELDDVNDDWEVTWDRTLLVPSPRGATDFRISTEWLRRGSILDRDGRKLATGDVENRSYPRGSLAGSVIGHIGLATKEQAKELDVQPGALVGGSGLEKGLQEELAGRPTTTLELINNKGRVVETLGRRRGEPGRSVKTTLDVEIQRAAKAAYGGTTGGAVVMDPATGDLMAIVSSSEIDPNGYVGTTITPFNRALLGTYPPGSSMKVVTAAAALDTGVVTPQTRLRGPAEYQGVRNFESGEFGQLSFASAVQFSVNTAFAQVALKLGAKRLSEYAERFGFNSVPEMPLEARESSFPPPAGAGDLMWASIGQAQVLASPLQMATVAATIANDGERMEPRITKLQEPVGEQVVSKETADTLTKLMVNVVVGGTGQAARLAGIDVAGKTGTAEVDVGGERKNHAWFISFAPADDPSVAIAVVSEYGGIGGQVAAPLARQILSNSILIIESDEFRKGNG